MTATPAYPGIGICPATLLADFANPTGDDVRRAAEAALRAGATGASVWTPHLDLLGGAEQAGAWFRAAGLPMHAVEAAVAWSSGEPDVVLEEAERLASSIAAAGATRLLAVTMDPSLPDLARAQANLAVLVDHIAAAGAQTCVEFLPWSGIPNLATAWVLVEPLGPEAGIVLDTWHWQRQPGGPNPVLLRQLPGERIGYVQLCDAAPGNGRELSEAMSGRLVPGDGVVDFHSLFEVLAETGADPFIATEIFNPAKLGELGQDAFAKASIGSGAAVRAGVKASG